jgi:hypothetical protein
VLGLGSTTLGIIETGIKQFRLFANASRLRVFSSETFQMGWLRESIWRGGWGIAVGYDAIMLMMNLIKDIPGWL